LIAPNAELVASGKSAAANVVLGDAFNAVTNCGDVAIDGTPVEVVLYRIPDAKLLTMVPLIPFTVAATDPDPEAVTSPVSVVMPPPDPVQARMPAETVQDTPSGLMAPKADPVASGSRAGARVVLGEAFSAVTTCGDVAIDGTPVEVVL
jgi:hypothetical protein